jgi:colanic acid/amylovoran biosynthesis glycosyltransferase
MRDEKSHFFLNGTGIGYRMSTEGVGTRPVVAIYTEPLLAPSMTFVRSQAEAMTFFSPYYISPHYLRNGLVLPGERVVVMHSASNGFSRLRDVPFKVFGFAPLFVRRLRKLNPVLLHAQFGPMGLRALPLARKLGIPLVVTFQGYDATVTDDYFKKSEYYSARAYLRRRKVLERGASLIIAVSNFIRDSLVRQGFAREKIVVHYCGVDTKFFRPDPGVKREPVVLYTGRLAEKKGCKYLITAMAQVQKECPGWELVLIGDGELRTSLEALAREKLHRYRFLGTQPPDVVRHWMNRAQVFCAPSVVAQCGDAEGLPNVLLEAQAMGLPVVSTAAGGMLEAVAQGKTGLLVREQDDQALAEALLHLLRNEPLRQQMGDAGRERMCSEFNLEIQTRKLETLYRELLEGSTMPGQVV